MKKHNHHINIHRLSLILYFVGLFLFLVGLLVYIEGANHVITQPVANVLNTLSLLLAGYHVISEGIVETIKDSISSKRFKPNIHVLMALGALGAVIIREYREASLLILIFAGAHYLEEYAQAKSKKEITNLLTLTPQYARLVNADGHSENVPVETLKIGDFVLVLNGDQVPTDGIIFIGEASLNESMITGESIPREKKRGDEVFGGSLNGNSTFTMQVTKDSSETVLAKILKVVSETQTNLTKTATFIKKFEPIYVTVVMLIAPLFYVFGRFALSWDHALAFNRMIILFIGASPCALAVSDIPATLSALSVLAKKGVIFKGGAPLSLFADVKAIAFDKTGTLTYGTPSVTDYIYLDEECDKALYSNLIYSMENKANHPLASAIIKFLAGSENLAVDVDNEIGKGISTNYKGSAYQIGKPSLFVLNEKEQQLVEKLATEGKTVVIFGQYEKAYVIIALLDEAKESAKEGITYFKNKGIQTVMITGDSTFTAQAIGHSLAVDDIYSSVLPNEKQAIIQSLKEKYNYVAMVGDGINDAPALVEATLGIAMGDGTDVAIDVADGVLVKNDFIKLAFTHEIAKKLKQIVIQNIIFAMTIVAILITSNFFYTLPMAAAVSIHEGSTVLVILNGLRLLNFRQKPLYKTK